MMNSDENKHGDKKNSLKGQLIGIILMAIGSIITFFLGVIIGEENNSEVETLGTFVGFLCGFIGFIIFIFSTKKWFDP